MRPLAPAQIAGTWIGVLVPYSTKGSLDVPRLVDEVEVLLSTNPDGIYTNGTAGEFFNQTEDEWDTISEVVAQLCERIGMPFQIGASSSNPVAGLGRLRRAVQLAPGAVQFILPSWLSLTFSEVCSFLDRVSDAAGDVGLVLYNSPQSKNELSPAALIELCTRFERIVGIKTNDGDEAWYRESAPLFTKASVFVPGHHVATGVHRGARGAYSNMAYLNPTGARVWAEKTLRDSRWGLQVERQVTAFMTAAIAPLKNDGYVDVALDKALAAAGGYLGPPIDVRWPHRTVTRDEVRQIRLHARRLLPEILHPAPKA